MGNLFLGFPVARAKIADMIATSAPPSLHKTQHQLGCSDELNVTGLTGAGGGLSVPFLNNLIYNDCGSITKHVKTTTGSSLIAASDNGIVLETFLTSSSEAELIDVLEFLYPHTAWTKARQFNCTVKLRSATSKDAEMYMISGSRSNSIGFGFYVSAGDLYAFSGDGTDTTYTIIQSLSAGPYTKYRLLRAVFTPGVKIEYYVDGILLLTITTTLPSGSSYYNYLANFYISNLATTEDKYLVVSDYMVLLNA